jgi:FkbM family methyltransferase
MVGRMPPVHHRIVPAVAAFLPAGMGQEAVARRLAQPFLNGTPDIRRSRIRGGASFDLDLADRIQAHTYFAGRYAPDVVACILAHLPAEGTFFDVGANVGLITFSVAARRPRARIHAFEPFPPAGASWRRNHELNPSSSVRLTEVAVAEASGTTLLETGENMGWNVTLDHRQRIERPDAELIEVPMIRLDDYACEADVDRIDVLKVDVEGHEPFVLEGAGRLIEDRRIGHVLCELNDGQLGLKGWSRERLIDWMADRGYQARALPQVGLRRLRRRDAADADVIFDAG